jgi:hypothetical protein
MQRPLSQPPPWKMGLSFPFFFFFSCLPFKKVQVENVPPVPPS